MTISAPSSPVRLITFWWRLPLTLTLDVLHSCCTVPGLQSIIIKLGGQGIVIFWAACGCHIGYLQNGLPEFALAYVKV